MLSFLVGGVTRGKAERAQSRKVWGVVERNEGNPRETRETNRGAPVPLEKT